MKYIFVLLCTCLVLFCSCDTIDDGDYQVNYLPPVPEGADMRYILLEDYTGIRCVNCPSAAEQARVLKETFGERLIVVSVHAGYNARPYPGGLYDLRSPAGDEYFKYFEISGNPNGTVNRVPYEGKSYFPESKWAGAVGAVPLKTSVSIKLDIHYTPTSRNYAVDMEIAKYNLSIGENADLILWLVEDKITTSQVIPSGMDMAYVQRHVLRGALNGTWGETISLPAPGATVKLSKEFTLPETYKEGDCSVVALLCDKNSKEVVQVAECMLIKK